MLFLGEKAEQHRLREVSTDSGAITFLRCEVLLFLFELTRLEEQAGF